jgi:2-dehydro-3-deoxygluconokinase
VRMAEGLIAIGEGLYEVGLSLGNGSREGLGGDAANTAVMAALVGARVAFVGRVGNDEIGRRLVAFWRRSGVDVKGVRVDSERSTGLYVNALSSDDLSAFVYYRADSAGSRLEPQDLPVGARAAYVHYTGVGLSVSETSAAACHSLARDVRRDGGRVSFGANVRPKLAPVHELLRNSAAAADVVFLSDKDAELLYGTSDGALAELSQTVPEVVLTLGAGGARVVAHGDIVACPTPEVDVIDTAGAGDALAGAYLAARMSGLTPGKAIELGVTVATLSCIRYGCALGYPSAWEVAAAASIFADRSGRTR